MEVQKMKDSIELNNHEVLDQYKRNVDQQIAELNAQLREFQCKNASLENNVNTLNSNLEQITHDKVPIFCSIRLPIDHFCKQYSYNFKEEEMRAIKNEYSEMLEIAQQQHENMIKEKEEELKRKDLTINEKEQEMVEMKSTKKTEIEKLENENKELQESLEMKKADVCTYKLGVSCSNFSQCIVLVISCYEMNSNYGMVFSCLQEDKLKAIVTEQCSTMHREFNKMRANIEAVNQKQNHALVNKVATLKKSILKLEKSKERLTHEYEKRIYHILKVKTAMTLMYQTSGAKSGFRCTNIFLF